MDVVAGCVRKVHIEVCFLLRVAAWIEFERRFGPERGVHRVVDEEVDLVGARAEARVPSQPSRERPAHAAHDRTVAGYAAELRRVASRGSLREARERLVEREAIRILEHPREVLWIQYSATCHADCRASSGAIHDAVLRIEHVAHQQRASAVRAVHARTRVRIAEIEPAVYPLAGIVGVGVYLLRAADELAEVAPELDVVVDPRTAPDLSRVPHVRITVGDELLGVVPLHAAARRRAVAVFDAQVGESAFAERQADIARNREALAVASSVPARAELQATARVGVFQDEVHHASDGI